MYDNIFSDTIVNDIVKFKHLILNQSPSLSLNIKQREFKILKILRFHIKGTKTSITKFSETTIIFDWGRS